MSRGTNGNTRYCIKWGRDVRHRRAVANMTRRDLAALAQIDPSYITLIERDGYTPSEQVCRRLALALEADLDLFLLSAGYATEAVSRTYLRHRKLKEIVCHT